MTISLPGLDAPTVDNTRERDLAVDRTPLPVVRQILDALAGYHGLGDGAIPTAHAPSRDAAAVRSARILDLGAGEGAWSQVARSLWPKAHITAIEPRPEAHEYLERHCNRIYGRRFQDCDLAELGAFDLVMGNPPFADFSASGERRNLFPELIEFGLRALDSTGVMCLYGLDDLGQRGAATIDTFARTPPGLQLRVCGSISHRGPKRDDVDGSGQGDARCYSAWVWYREDCDGRPDGRGWTTKNLPLLPASDRRWIVTPGTEETP